MVSPDKLLTCEAFRDTTPLQKAKVVLTGDEAVHQYLESKQASSQDTSQPTKLPREKDRTHLAGK
jgi:hypothetical protein